MHKKMAKSQKTNKDLLISAHSVTKTFNDKNVLEDISLNIHKKEIIFIIGPNGGGKSTLIKVLLSLLPINNGKIWRKSGLKVSYLSQTSTLNSSIPLTVKRLLALSGNKDKSDLQKVLELTQTTELLDKDFHSLSGGQTQRVLLARCLLRKPELLILDEPEQGLDVQGRIHLYQLLKEIRDIYSCAILIVSHDLHLVMASADEVICLNHHICCSGKPQALKDCACYLSFFPHASTQDLGIYTHQHNHSHPLSEGGCDCHKATVKTHQKSTALKTVRKAKTITKTINKNRNV